MTPTFPAPPLPLQILLLLLLLTERRLCCPIIVSALDLMWYLRTTQAESNLQTSLKADTRAWGHSMSAASPKPQTPNPKPCPACLILVAVASADSDKMVSRAPILLKERRRPCYSYQCSLQHINLQSLKTMLLKILYTVLKSHRNNWLAMPPTAVNPKPCALRMFDQGPGIALTPNHEAYNL